MITRTTQKASSEHIRMVALADLGAPDELFPRLRPNDELVEGCPKVLDDLPAKDAISNLLGG